jgi:hypothetical protein
LVAYPIRSAFCISGVSVVIARKVNRRWLARLSDRRQVIRLPRMDDGSLQIAYVAYFLRRVSTHMITEDDRFGFEVTCILSIKKPFYKKAFIKKPFYFLRRVSIHMVPEDIRTVYTYTTIGSQ